jgi:ribosomal protein S11
MQKRQGRSSQSGLIVVKCTSSNTIIHASDRKGRSIVVSSGNIGFRGSNRATTHAAQKTGELIAKKLRKFQQKKVVAMFRGAIDMGNKNKKAVVKGLKKYKVNIKKIVVETQIAHNGCRVKKKKR